MTYGNTRTTKKEKNTLEDMTQMDLKCEVVSKGSNKGRTGFALCHNVIPRKNEIFYKFLF